eukprot:g5266.t1
MDAFASLNAGRARQHAIAEAASVQPLDREHLPQAPAQNVVWGRLASLNARFPSLVLAGPLTSSGSWTIGRSTQAALLVSHPHVSKVHCRLVRWRSGFAVEDFSRHGCRVNREGTVAELAQRDRQSHATFVEREFDRRHDAQLAAYQAACAANEVGQGMGEQAARERIAAIEEARVSMDKGMRELERWKAAQLQEHGAPTCALHHGDELTLAHAPDGDEARGQAPVGAAVYVLEVCSVPEAQRPARAVASRPRSRGSTAGSGGSHAAGRGARRGSRLSHAAAPSAGDNAIGEIGDVSLATAPLPKLGDLLPGPDARPRSRASAATCTAAGSASAPPDAAHPITNHWSALLARRLRGQTRLPARVADEELRAAEEKADADAAAQARNWARAGAEARKAVVVRQRAGAGIQPYDVAAAASGRRTARARPRTSAQPRARARAGSTRGAGRAGVDQRPCTALDVATERTAGTSALLLREAHRTELSHTTVFYRDRARHCRAALGRALAPGRVQRNEQISKSLVRLKWGARLGREAPLSWFDVHDDFRMTPQQQRAYGGLCLPVGDSEGDAARSAAARAAAAHVANPALREARERALARELQANAPVWARRGERLWIWNPFVTEKTNTKYQCFEVSGYEIDGKKPWQFAAEFSRVGRLSFPEDKPSLCKKKLATLQTALRERRHFADEAVALDRRVAGVHGARQQRLTCSHSHQ